MNLLDTLDESRAALKKSVGLRGLSADQFEIAWWAFLMGASTAMFQCNVAILQGDNPIDAAIQKSTEIALRLAKDFPITSDIFRELHNGDAID